MAQLSELVALFKRTRGAQQSSGQLGPRTSAQPPAMPGFARGALGSSGARLFQGRDSNRGLQKELELMQSPVFQAFLQQFAPQMPLTNFLRGK